MNEQLRNLMYFTDAVNIAVRERRAVVALESTVIAHGLPRPVNIETAREMEAVVREAGAIPATIALLNGRIHYGLTPNDLERVGTDATIGKVSLRDLPIILARGGSGATTVSATAYLAAQADINVFATGGIGGVHRGWAGTMDISADLHALAQISVVTVCAGAKSVLDLPTTLEWLETHGVPVLGYRTDYFPAFYSPMTEPPLPVDIRVESAQEVAEIFFMRRRLGFQGGVLLCVPIPDDAAIPYAEIESAIAEALRDAEAQGVKGRAVTPFLLQELSKATDGRSLAAYRALLLNNARVAAEVARAISPARYV
jgi:pseudouridine-5'-phosphate glycosidase